MGPSSEDSKDQEQRREEPGLWEQDTKSLGGAALIRFLAIFVTLSTVGAMMHKTDVTKLRKPELEP